MLLLFLFFLVVSSFTSIFFIIPVVLVCLCFFPLVISIALLDDELNGECALPLLVISILQMYLFIHVYVKCDNALNGTYFIA